MAVANGNNILLSKHIPLTRRRILTLLKERGELTADELAELLGISAVAVRRHLNKLESEQLVTYQEIQRGMGRPSFVYHLDEAADNFFPRRYEELAVNMLDTVRDLYGDDAVETIFKKRRGHIIEKYRGQVTGESLELRLEQLTRLREADGYMSTWERSENGTFVLCESNCPIIHVAEGCRTACDHDLALLTEVLGAEIVRKSHLAGGDSACVYEVRPKTPSE